MSKGSKMDMDQSFLMSNMSPQLPEFNRQGWKNIESEVRNLLKTQDSIIVYTGPILSNIDKYIGGNRVGVPKAFYKAVLLGDSSKAYAYLVPHQKLSKPYSKYIVTVDSLERILEIDLFEGLREDLEKSFR